jgi:hypothetical protein
MVLMLSATGDGRGEVEVVVQVVVVVQVAVTLGFIFLSASGPTISYGGDAVDSLAVVQPSICIVKGVRVGKRRVRGWSGANKRIYGACSRKVSLYFPTCATVVKVR